jgi:hypothetical protein
MGLIPLGILSSAGGGFGTYELIQTTILGSAASSVTLSGLDAYAGVYKHLQIRAMTRDTIGSGPRLAMRLNSDTAANYSYHALFARGSSVVSTSGTSTNEMWMAVDAAYSGLTANAFTAAVTDILDSFSTSKNKTIRTFYGHSANEHSVGLVSGSWRNTSSVSSITVIPFQGTAFVTGSRFSIYGIR